MSNTFDFVDAEDDDNNGDESSEAVGATQEGRAQTGDPSKGHEKKVDQGRVEEMFPLIDGPMPEKQEKTVYPFEYLEVGQGRRICRDEEKLRQRLYSAKYSYQAKHHTEFEVRRRDGFVELWRTK